MSVFAYQPLISYRHAEANILGVLPNQILVLSQRLTSPPQGPASTVSSQHDVASEIGKHLRDNFILLCVQLVFLHGSVLTVATSPNRLLRLLPSTHGRI